MEQKDRYTLRDLFNNLEITMTELKNRSAISDVTLSKIRNGGSARLSTINVLLRIFSEIYGIKLSLHNVDGITIQGKSVDTIINPSEKPARPRVIKKTLDNTPAIEVSQICPTTQKVEVQTEIPDHLPHGTIKLADFAERHCIRKERIRDWVRDGIKGEKIETTLEMVKRANGGSQTHFLTPEQQEKALEFLQRHGKLKTPQPEQEERPWYAPDGG